MCDNSILAARKATLQEGQIQHFDNEFQNHQNNGRKSNIMNIIELFENLSKKQETEKFTAENSQKKTTHISSGEKSKHLQCNSKRGAGAGVGGQKRGGCGIYSDKKAKISSAQKHKSAIKHRPITNFFKPTQESESPIVKGNNSLEAGKS